MISDCTSRVALISYHTCPLAAPGQGKAGGMNVHVRELAKAMANRGAVVDVFTRGARLPMRRERSGEATGLITFTYRPGLTGAPLSDLPNFLDDFVAGVEAHTRRRNGIQLPGYSFPLLAERLGRLAVGGRHRHAPRVVTFHTLSRIKMQSRSGEQEPPVRQDTEEQHHRGCRLRRGVQPPRAGCDGTALRGRPKPRVS